MDNLIYYDEDNELWVINDLEATPPGHAILKLDILTSYISIAIPGMDAPIKNVDPTTIYKDAGKTEQYTSLSDLKTTCAGLFKRTVLSSNVILSDASTQTPDGVASKLSDSLAQIVAWLNTLQAIVDDLANATGMITFDDLTLSTSEQVLTFTVSSASTNTDLLDFDASNSIINYVANAKFNMSSLGYVSNTDGLDHTITLNVYSVVDEVETLIDTLVYNVPRKSDGLLLTDDYIDTITDAPRDVRLKVLSSSATKVSFTGYIMKIIATNPE